MNEVYRSCASILVFRPAEVCSPDGCQTLYEILLLHKPRKNDAWQLPQGGVEEGETTEQAALRELKEEAGIEAKVLGKSENRYKYDFPASYRRFRPDKVCGQCIEFVFAKTEPNVQIQVDHNEIDNYVWILPDEVSTYIKRKAYIELFQKLVKDGMKLL